MLQEISFGMDHTDDETIHSSRRYSKRLVGVEIHVKIKKPHSKIHELILLFYYPCVSGELKISFLSQALVLFAMICVSLSIIQNCQTWISTRGCQLNVVGFTVFIFVLSSLYLSRWQQSFATIFSFAFKETWCSRWLHTLLAKAG